MEIMYDFKLIMKDNNLGNTYNCVWNFRGLINKFQYNKNLQYSITKIVIVNCQGRFMPIYCLNTSGQPQSMKSRTCMLKLACCALFLKCQSFK